MNPHSVFWATIEALAHDLRREGPSDMRRAENIATTLESLPKERRDKHLACLEQVVESLPTILAYCQSRDGETSFP
jgi:hypothetical protein